MAFAVPVTSIDEVRAYLLEYQKRYFDARHLCYAYKLGLEGAVFRANDNGEPSGTAGKPILGQINSLNLTDVLVMVVRYFGGIKLGTSGLIVAYRTVAAEALANAQIIDKTVDRTVAIQFEYPFLNNVMKVVKEMSPEIIHQQFDMDCQMSLRMRKSLMQMLINRLEKVETLQFIE